MQLHSTTPDSATRRHRPKTLTVFAAAFAAGAVLAYGVDRVVDIHVVQVEPQVECEPIFVALRSLPQGSPITVWDVALKDWPKAMLPTTALKADASLEGMVLRHPVREGQPLLSVQLVRDAALLPGAAVAALPPVTQPAGATEWAPAQPVAPAAGAANAAVAERFVPATPAAPPATAAVALPEPDVAAGAPDASGVAAPQATFLADTDIEPATEATVAAAPVVTADPADVTDSTLAAIPAPLETPPASPVVEPVSAPVEIMAAQPTIAAATEPVLARVASTAVPPAAVESAAPLAAPVPNLPTTDIERSLSVFGRTKPEPQEEIASVLDRTTEAPPVSPQQAAPRHHLVVPERIALAVDASFTQRPEPAGAPQPTAEPTVAAGEAARQDDRASSGSASVATSRSTRAAAEVSRQQASRQQASRQPAAAKSTGKTPPKATAQPSGKQPSSPARGMSAWLKQFSGGTWQR